MQTIRHFLSQALALTISPNDVGVPTVKADQATLDNVLNAVFTIIGAISILILILASYTYITSGGNPGKAQQAKDAILYTVIGIIVSLSGFAIVQAILGRI
ncbi:MAG TPA: hypothetical protein VNG90_01830 [Candidatus Acidoferrum sp.]|nr:hypothetical protein [Candidatus Acidoferrum sp.]